MLKQSAVTSHEKRISKLISQHTWFDSNCSSQLELEFLFKQIKFLFNQLNLF